MDAKIKDLPPVSLAAIKAFRGEFSLNDLERCMPFC